MHVYAAFFISQLKGLFTDTINFRENKKKKGHKTSFHKEECSFPLTSLGLTGRRAAPPVSSLSKEENFPGTGEFLSQHSVSFLKLSVWGSLFSLSFPCPASISKGTNLYWQALPAALLICKAKPK